MQKWTFIVCFFLVFGISFRAVSQSSFVVYDTIPIKHGTNKMKLYRNVDKWFEKEKGQKLIAKNRKELKFQGKGYFPYVNYVQIPDVYLSSHAAEKTKGSIVFSISVSIQDSILVTKFYNFIHEARFSEYGSTSYGLLMKYEKIPSGKCMEMEEWCNAVWADMKDWAYYETKVRAKRMIPNNLIRKRTYKVEDEKPLEPPKTMPYDPNEYLKLDNYLLKDTEGKYADYDKWPEDIEAEKAAAAAAAAELAEKEKKKGKEQDVSELLEQPEENAEEQTAETPTEEVEQTAEEPVVEEKAEESDDSYDDEDSDDEDEKVAAKPSKEKTKKEKVEKTPKEKKDKKPKDDYDDYDDYDDEDYDDY